MQKGKVSPESIIKPESALAFLVWLSTEAVAYFHSPVLPFFPPCLLLLSSLISIEETLSARLSKLENYGFDQLVSQRNWYHLLKEKSGFWGTRLFRRDVAAGYTRDANRMSGGSFCGGREDIYLFGTMITGILLIGLGFALGYQKIRKTGTAVQSLTRLPVWIEAVGRAVSNETETINRNMDAIMLKLTALQVKIDYFRDQNGQREQKLWRYAAVRPKRHNKM